MSRTIKIGTAIISTCELAILTRLKAGKCSGVGLAQGLSFTPQSVYRNLKRLSKVSPDGDPPLIEIDQAEHISPKRRWVTLTEAGYRLLSCLEAELADDAEAAEKEEVLSDLELEVQRIKDELGI